MVELAPRGCEGDPMRSADACQTGIRVRSRRSPCNLRSTVAAAGTAVIKWMGAAYGARTVIVALLAIATHAAAATGVGDEEAGYRKLAGNYVVYLGVLPAEIADQPASAPDTSSPYQPAPARDTHLVLVSITDASGRKIEHAGVEARVAELGFSGERKTLAPIALGSVPAYGARFPMRGRGPFRVDVRFRVAGSARDEQVRFYFTHPRFAPPRPGKG